MPYVDGNVGVAVEVNAETDFVAKNADFQAFVKTVAETVASVNPADMDALLAAQAAGQSVSVEDLRKEKVLTIGENIKIRRFQRYEGAVTAYIHMGGKIAVLVRFDTSAEIAAKAEFQEYAKNIAMQIAAVNPLYLNSSVVPADVIEHERKIATEQASTSGKPANVIEKMVDGKIKKYFQGSLPGGAGVCQGQQALHPAVQRIPSPRSWAVPSRSPSMSALRRARVLRSVRTTSLTKLPAW